MPIRHAIWKVAAKPVPLAEGVLATEKLLEEMIVSDPRLLSDEWMLIGRQADTGFGGRIDLLAVAPDASLVLIELKRDRTPREVVAQSLDYAGWAERLTAEEIDRIYRSFAPGKSLAQDFQQRYGFPLEEESLNQSHQVVVVASSLDPSTERIVSYLDKHGISINVLFFQVFMSGSEQLLSRAWMIDPVEVQVSAAARAPEGGSEPWNGEFYVSFGDGMGRSWADAVKYGFISAGGGAWYSRTLQLLNSDDRVWVNIPGRGYVGVGTVTGPAQQASDFRVLTAQGEVPLLDVAKGADYHNQFLGDPERTEWFVPVQWLQTVPAERAFHEIGMFGNQNSVCKPTTPKWRWTVERLKERFSQYDKVPGTAAVGAAGSKS